MRIEVPRLHSGGKQHLAGLCLICGHWGGHQAGTDRHVLRSEAARILHTLNEACEPLLCETFKISM